MSIIIQGMEMPKNCLDCPCNYDLFKCIFTDASTLTIGDDERLPSCPLIELPPHGIIDKQMLLRNIADNQMANAGMRHDLEYGFWQRMWEYINGTPTIIEAEGEE